MSRGTLYFLLRFSMNLKLLLKKRQLKKRDVLIRKQKLKRLMVLRNDEGMEKTCVHYSVHFPHQTCCKIPLRYTYNNIHCCIEGKATIRKAKSP